MTNEENGPQPNPDTSAAMRQFLSDIPSPQIPPEVSQRILAAITAESQTRSAEDKSNVSALPRRSRFRRLLPVAASAAAIGLLGFLVWPLVGDGDTPSTFAAATGCTVSADSGADMSPVLHASGATYTEVSLVSQAESMAQQPAAMCSEVDHDDPASFGFGTSDSKSGAGDSSSATDSTEVMPLAEGDPDAGITTKPENSQNPEETPLLMSVPTPALGEGNQDQAASAAPGELRSEPLVSQCVVSSVEGRVVHAIDVATFDGQPALVVVVGSPREVLALKCGPGRPKVLAQRAMSRQQ